MDFRQTIQPNGSRPSAHTPQPTHNSTASDDASRTIATYTSAPGSNLWFKVLTVTILVGIAILLAAIALGVGHAKSDASESKFIQKGKFQAVFLNNGQVYFGSIQSLNDQYIRMTNIYYLTQADGGSANSTSGNSNNYSLVKLGCQQIHDPYDTMVINRQEVSFWENLQDNGKVVSSINKFKQQNPNGPDCSQVSSQTQASNSSTQGAATGTNTTGSQGKQ